MPARASAPAMSTRSATARRSPERPRVVVGPGTGLGAGALIHARGTWIPVPGEGGHIDLGPVTERDFALWPHLEQSFGRISAETLLCGPGLMRLYRASAAFERPASAARPRRPRSPPPASPATIPAAVEALDFFATHLGRFAGNLAVVFVATGGVYLAGGISAKIAPALKSGAFREAFVAKEPHRHLVERDDDGDHRQAGRRARRHRRLRPRPGRFGVELAGRAWRG